LTVTNLVNTPERHAKFSGKFFERSPAVLHNSRLLFSQPRVRVLCPNLRRSVFALVGVIASNGVPPKVGQMAVGSNAISVTSLMPFWAWPTERKQNKAMNEFLPTNTTASQVHAQVAC
jgi:hypothetical protein